MKESVLHFAPEFSLARYIKRLVPRRYVKADSLASFILGICVRPDIVIDLRQLELESQSFNLVICNHVLEHVTDDARALAEISRVLQFGGKALITVPISTAATLEDPAINTAELRSLRYGSPDHVRMYGMDIVGRFRAAGFHVEVCYARDCLPSAQIEEQLLEPNEPHFILTKAVDCQQIDKNPNSDSV